MKLQKSNKFIGIFLILSILVLFGVLTYTLTHITTFMEVLATCADDFAIIEKCGCIPW